VLFCTNRWQHQRPDGLFKRQAEALPRLLAQYIARLGESVHLVHAGPEAYDLEIQLGKRYHWLPPLAPADFESMIAAMDLMVSANISATTIAKAMTHGVPVVVLQNSASVTSREDAEAAVASESSVWLRAWLEQAVPLLPFSLWPVGFHRFLTPLLRDNPYVAALDIAEILDERRTEATLAGLLFEPSRREDHLHRQSAYLNQIRSLPTGAETIKAIC
jgi:CheY-like chemotaxis protein